MYIKPNGFHWDAVIPEGVCNVTLVRSVHLDTLARPPPSVSPLPQQTAITPALAKKSWRELIRGLDFL